MCKAYVFNFEYYFQEDRAKKFHYFYYIRYTSLYVNLNSYLSFQSLANILI